MTKPKLTSRFAEDTEVPVERSRAEIERLLRKHGATGFLSSWDEQQGRSVMMCRLDGRMLRFDILNPTLKEMSVTAGGKNRSKDMARKAMAQEERRRWRAQLLIIKAKLEMVAMGGTTVEAEFLASVMLPDGSTVGAMIAPKLREAYENAQMPSFPMLPAEIPGGDPGKKRDR